MSEAIVRNSAVRRMRAHRLMRQIHLWVGAWGALAAILFGLTGLMQNHRAIMKLPQGESIEIARTQIDVPEAARTTPEALRDWLRDEHHVPIDNVRVQGGGDGAPRNGGESGQRNRGGARWMFSGGNARLTWNAEYTPGSPSIEVRNSEQSALAILSRLHKGVGGGVAWILLTDSFAISMVLLGITGIVMWARGRGAKQVMLSALGAALLVLVLIGGSAVL